jgi:glucose-1-phosphate cytidylyltransferase
MADMTIDMSNKSIEYHANYSEPWRVTLIDTGEETMTGGRVKRARKYIGDETFMLTYGDGVGDIEINELIRFHKSHKMAMTLTSVQPEGRFGSLRINHENKVESFLEKPKGDGGWINAGFFVCEPKILDYIEDDKTVFELDPLEGLAKDGELFAYKHYGFWKPMDNIRDKVQLEEMILRGTAPWIKW